MFKTEGQEAKKSSSVNKTLEPGVVKAHIYGATVRTSKTNKKSLELILEAPAPDNFEGWPIDKNNPDGPKFSGPMARVSATIYIADYESDDINRNEILNKLVVIADRLGLRKQLDKLGGNKEIKNVEQYVAKAVEVLRGHDMYWFLAGKEDEYNDKVIIRLSLPKIKFCSVNESEIPKFDKNNKYHYTPLVNKSVSGFEPTGNDFDL